MERQTYLRVRGRLEWLLALSGVALLLYAIAGLSLRAVAKDYLLSEAASEVKDPAPPKSPPQRSVKAAANLEVIPDFTGWSGTRVNLYNMLADATPEAEAILDIPGIALTVPVVSGTSEKNLNVAAGRIEGSAEYGSPGNLSIAAHRDSYFRKLGELEVGDLIVIQKDGQRWTYQTRATFVVEPTDTFVLNQTPDSTITLITCYPFYFVGSAPERFVVRGVLVDHSEPAPQSPH